MLPSVAVSLIERFCEARSPAYAKDEMRIGAVVESTAVTIVERHAPWGPDPDSEWTSTPVARLRYTGTTGKWTLQCPTTDGGWRRYDGIGATASVDPLLREIERDPTYVFWGELRRSRGGLTNSTELSPVATHSTSDSQRPGRAWRGGGTPTAVSRGSECKTRIAGPRSIAVQGNPRQFCCQIGYIALQGNEHTAATNAS